jgi:hypothetical protein
MALQLLFFFLYKSFNSQNLQVVFGRREPHPNRAGFSKPVVKSVKDNTRVTNPMQDFRRVSFFFLLNEKIFLVFRSCLGACVEWVNVEDLLEEWKIYVICSDVCMDVWGAF